MVKKVLLLYTVSMVVALYTTFVLTLLWGWFVVPAFHVDGISFWVMYGITMLIGLLRSPGDPLTANHRHEIVATMLDACVPVDKRREVTEQLAKFDEQQWYEAGGMVLGQMIVNTITLGKWRQEHPDVRPDLRGADLSSADLSEADLFRANLRRANLPSPTCGALPIRHYGHIDSYPSRSGGQGENVEL